MNLEDLKKLCQEATPGPWGLKEHGLVSSSFPNSCGENYQIAGDIDEQDADFIAAAREALPKLIAVAEAARVVAAGFRRFYDENEQPLVDALAALEETA